MKSKKELQALADKTFFLKDSGQSAMIATEDGQFFYPESIAAARAHADSNNIKTFVLERKGGLQPVGGDSSKEYAMSSKKLVAAINAAKNKKELVAIHKANKIDEDDRTTVTKAYTKAAEKFNVEVAKVKVTETAPATVDELLKKLAGVKTEADLDKLEAEFNLSKHESAEVAKAFEEKETSFL